MSTMQVVWSVHPEVASLAHTIFVKPQVIEDHDKFVILLIPTLRVSFLTSLLMGWVVVSIGIVAFGFSIGKTGIVGFFGIALLFVSVIVSTYFAHTLQVVSQSNPVVRINILHKTINVIGNRNVFYTDEVDDIAIIKCDAYNRRTMTHRRIEQLYFNMRDGDKIVLFHQVPSVRGRVLELIGNQLAAKLQCRLDVIEITADIPTEYGG